jgi:hypothetical protein
MVAAALRGEDITGAIDGGVALDGQGDLAVQDQRADAEGMHVLGRGLAGVEGSGVDLGEAVPPQARLEFRPVMLASIAPTPWGSRSRPDRPGRPPTHPEW